MGRRKRHLDTSKKLLKCMFCDDVAEVPEYTTARCCSSEECQIKYGVYRLNKKNSLHHDDNETDKK